MSLTTVEIESFSGPAIVEIVGSDEPSLVHFVSSEQPEVVYINQGPEGPAGPAGTTESLIHRVKNGTIAVTKGQAVYITGASGGNVIIGLAQANGESTSSKTIGLVTTDIDANGFGYVITDGVLSGTGSAQLDTSGATTEGDAVWLSPTVAGGRVYGNANKPSSPNHMVYLGVVSRKSATVGEILVKVQNGFELQELHNVSVGHTTPIAVSDILYCYDSTTNHGYWENKPLADVAVTLTGNQTIDGNKTFEGSTLFNQDVLFSDLALLGNSINWSINTNGNGRADFTSLLIQDLTTDGYGTISPSLISASTSRLYNLPDASGIIALTSSTTGVPDKLSLANSKTTPIDADASVIFDSAASNAAKNLTFANLWTWISTKLNAYTATGAWSFSSATRPTSSGTGLPATTSLLNLSDSQLLIARDHTTYFLNFSLSSTSVAGSGTSNASRGYWQLFTSTTASSKAQSLFDITALCFQATQIDYSRRIILKTRITGGALRSGLQFYFQLGRTIAVNTAVQLDKKGFGFGITGSTVTPFVHNGTSLSTATASGTPFSILSYPQVMLDFRPAVSLDIYGIASSSSTPVLLATMTSGLPTGASNSGDGQLECLVYDTGSGGANNWMYLGQSSITVL